MALFSRRSSPVEAPAPAPSLLDTIAQAVRRMDRARSDRDNAIFAARGRHPQREIAEAAGLSVSRIKQMGEGPHRFHGPDPARFDPVTDVDAPVAVTDRGSTVDRVLSIRDIDPFIPEWPSERAFLEEKPERGSRNVWDISHRFFDLDPREAWNICFLQATKEVYAFRSILRSPNDPPLPPEEQNIPGRGSANGPCILLGHVASQKLMELALDRPASVVRERPGGLAWAYGRIRLTNTILKAVADPLTGLTADPETIWTYLRSLPESEQP